MKAQTQDLLNHSQMAHLPDIAGPAIIRQVYSMILNGRTKFLHSITGHSNINEPQHDKTNKMSVSPAKTQISLGIRPVWSVFAQWVAKDPRFLHADSKDSDQSGRMPRLIRVFAGRTATLLVLSCHGSNSKMLDGSRTTIMILSYPKVW